MEIGCYHFYLNMCKKTVRAQIGSLVVKVPALRMPRIPQGHRFISWLLHSPTSALPVAWGQQRTAQALGPPSGAFPRALTGSWIGSRATEISPGTPMGCKCFSYYTTVPALLSTS